MKVKVSKLTPHPLNLEIYDLSSIEDLMASITEMGLLQNLVIDPFMGTGTTGKVANQYGRRFIGYDIQTY